MRFLSKIMMSLQLFYLDFKCLSLLIRPGSPLLVYRVVKPVSPLRGKLLPSLVEHVFEGSNFRLEPFLQQAKRAAKRRKPAPQQEQPFFVATSTNGS